MHYITAIGFDEAGYIYANDPNKTEVPRKQLQNKFQSCMKQAFIFWPEAQEIPLPDPERTVEPEPDTPDAPKMDGVIVDISDHKGKIDFDKLKEVASLVIARASCGSDKDSRIDEYATEMNKRKIPFGVYCYSYAGTVAKAKDEVEKMISYASKYNPLFYVLDAEESRLTNETIRAFAKYMRDNGIERAGCYVAHHRYKSYNYDSLRSLFNFTWIPCYGANNGTIESSKRPSYVCDLWQYTSKGRTAGINGNSDINVITGQGKTLSWFLGGESGDETVEPVVERLVEIVNGNVNVRTEAGTSGAIIGVAARGSTLAYRGQTASNGWLTVKFNGQDGWISGKYGKLL